MKALMFGISWMVLGLIGYAQEKPKKGVPALSYHNVREYTSPDPSYFITPAGFETHIKVLKEAGFQSVLPQEVEDSYFSAKPLPEKPILISFDDTRVEHFLTVAPILEKYGFRGTFYIMTVSIGKPNYMSKAQIQELAKRGHAIGLHT